MHADLAVGVGPVLTELLAGARSTQVRETILEGSGVIAYLEANDRTWRMAGDIRSRMRNANLTIGFADTIIAALAIQHGLELYTLDRDFERIEGLHLHPADGIRSP